MSAVPLHYAMKMYGGAEVELHAFLTSALDGDQLQVPVALSPAKEQLDIRLGEHQSRSGRCGEGKKSSR
jgi:hypothetical protein